MAMPEIWGRVLNLEEYHVKGIKAVKALLQIATALGPQEAARVHHIVRPYTEFVQNHSRLRSIWEGNDSDIFAITDTYPKTLSHWVEGNNQTLKFMVHWGYRHDWRAFHVVYSGRDDETEETIWDLNEDLKERPKKTHS